MAWGIVAGAAVSVVGGALSASAAGDAADAQGESAAQSNALQRYMYDNNAALQAPTINTGNAARDRLSFLLGLSPTGFSGGAGGTSSTQALTYDQLRSQLQGQYTRNGTTGPAFNPDVLTQMERMRYEQIKDIPSMRAEFEASHTGNPRDVADNSGVNPGQYERRIYDQQQGTSTIDEQGLDGAIRARLAEQEAAQRAREEAARADPNYGRLAQQFQFDTYTPDKFSYTGEDLYKDPSYQWRLSQGQKALDRQGAASGRFLSGRQLQAASDYGQGAASQEFQAGYGRARDTFGTNEGNRFNAFSTNQGNRFNAFQANFNNSVNPLLALSGAATLGSQNLGASGAAMANNVGNTMMGNANVQGAAGIAGANAISGGLNNAYGGYQQNQLVNSLLNRPSVNNNPYGASGAPAYGNNSLFGTGTGGMGD